MCKYFAFKEAVTATVLGKYSAFEEAPQEQL